MAYIDQFGTVWYYYPQRPPKYSDYYVAKHSDGSVSEQYYEIYMDKWYGGDDPTEWSEIE